MSFLSTLLKRRKKTETLNAAVFGNATCLDGKKGGICL